MSGMEIQTFFYLLQQCGEEAGLMAPDAKELDEYAPSEMGTLSVSQANFFL